VDDEGELISGDTLLLLFNGDQVNDIPFTLPPARTGEAWQRMLDTADLHATAEIFQPGAPYNLQHCSMALLRLYRQEEEEKTVP
jgi:hypothetical protein